MPTQAPVGARARLRGAELVVAGQLEHALEAREVVARVVDRPRRRPVGHLLGAHEVAARELGGIEAEAPRGDVHRALERAVELRAAEAAIEARRRAIGDDDAAAHGEILDVVGAGQAAVHAIERGRLGRADVRADLVDQVEPQAEQAAVGVERRLDLARALGRHRGRQQVLAAVLRPAHGHAEAARGDRHQHDGVQHGGLGAERAAALGRREQPQLRARDAERGGRDAVQREGPLEVRPRRHARRPASARSRRSTRPAWPTSAGGGSARARRAPLPRRPRRDRRS